MSDSNIVAAMTANRETVVRTASGYPMLLLQLVLIVGTFYSITQAHDHPAYGGAAAFGVFAFVSIMVGFFLP